MEDRIYFSCNCGKNLSIDKKYAGKSGICPQCNKKLKIPFDSTRERESQNITNVAKKSQQPIPTQQQLKPILDRIHTKYKDKIMKETFFSTGLILKLSLPKYRSHEVSITLAKDERNILGVRVKSVIGTLTYPHEMEKILKLNGTLTVGKLFIDDARLVQMQCYIPLRPETYDDVLWTIEYVLSKSDQIEEHLFGIDVR